ncbi:uncharacterized protein LOC118377581 isoform X6 [Oncorhynchus keta]|uniref:uncharacterized protein LOC118377581 isoform X6 n=1 Tax=Oncorhynchus keta TaxID=8018 RepID=UPI00227B20BD|nr:uncharacterized protein LOC118377581 isoform X6 [Oncorhynchus keta]
MAVQRYSLHWMSWGPHLLQLDVLGASSPSAGCPGGLISFSWMSWGPHLLQLDVLGSSNLLQLDVLGSSNLLQLDVLGASNLLQLDILGASSPSAGCPGGIISFSWISWGSWAV